MIGLDTNVMIRYITQDDPIQSKMANRLLGDIFSSGELVWINQITLCEIYWVLESCYHLSKKKLVEVIKMLLEIKQIEFEHEETAWEALKDFESMSKVDFVDCLIGRQNEKQKCLFTYTFDRGAAQLPTFQQVTKD